MERNMLRHSMVDDQSSSFELIFVMLLDGNHNRPYEIGFCEKSKHPQFKWSANIHHRFLNVVERVEGKKDENHNRSYEIICEKSKQHQFKWSSNHHHRFFNVVERRFEGKKGATPKAIFGADEWHEPNIKNKLQTHFQIYRSHCFDLEQLARAPAPKTIIFKKLFPKGRPIDAEEDVNPGPSSPVARNEGQDDGPLDLTLSIRPPNRG
nr:transcription activator GLK2-like isoform X2 [Ipomoea batatas]